MAYTNSPLVSYTKISPNKSINRNHAIDTISIHCMAGNLSIEQCGNLFANPSKQASSNYGIGSDGRIGLYVEEKDRSWCTSSSSNDNRAITIEVANTQAKDPWPVSDAAMASLIKLCADICKRNNIKKLLWKGDKNLIGQVDKQNMTVHRWFAAKACPGDYLYSRHGYIADEVNKILGQNTPIEPVTPDKPKGPTQPTAPSNYKVGDVVKLKANATYYNGVSIPNFVKKSTLYYRGTNKNGIIISTQKTGAITGVVKADALEGGISTPAQPTQPTTSSIYTVKVTANCLNIRRGPGTNYGISSQIRDKGVYTIIETRGNWGRLKSGRGWICLDYTKKC